MQWEVASLNERARLILLDVSRSLSLHFPLHGQTLHAELAGMKLTNDRWSRILYVLLATVSIPGSLLNDDERECRATALRVVALARMMLAVTSGVGRDPEYLSWSADMHIREFEEVGPSSVGADPVSIERTFQEI